MQNQLKLTNGMITSRSIKSKYYTKLIINGRDNSNMLLLNYFMRGRKFLFYNKISCIAWHVGPYSSLVHSQFWQFKNALLKLFYLISQSERQLQYFLLNRDMDKNTVTFGLQLHLQ